MPARVPRADPGTGPGPTVEAEGLLAAGPVAGAPPTAVRRRTNGDRHRAVGTTVAGGPERHIGRRPSTMAARLAAAVPDRPTRPAGRPGPASGPGRATLAGRLVRVTVRTTTAVARPDESVRVPQGAVGRGPLVPPAPAGRTMSGEGLAARSGGGGPGLGAVVRAATVQAATVLGGSVVGGSVLGATALGARVLGLAHPATGGRAGRRWVRR